MYMFLIERAHIIRAPYERRIHDKAWVACMSFLIVGFGAIAVIAFVWPNAEVSTRDGKCRIGQPLKVTIPLLTYDIVVNVSLTALFVHFLYPFLAPKGNRISLGQSLSSFRFGSQQRKSPNCSPNQDRVTGRLRRLVVKTVVGGVLVMIPTVANLTGVLITRGREQGWMCLTLCSLDVTWTVTVVHWLTVNSQEVEDDIRSYHGNNPKLQPCAIGDNVDLFKSTLKSAAEVEVVESASSATIMPPPQAYGTKSIHHDIVEKPLGSI
ncbi:hypothetical protein DL95DRAFT_394752 [Leptodontidium sp. 2 PMI_412]|nr:hypothetical protein DL95DRAFT_394752 [Leptodontidium sp. 2 PMI_412]